MSTFTTSQGTSTFTADRQAWAEPATSEVAIRGFPGGNAIAVSLAGQREVKRTVTCILASLAAYRAFAGQRNKLGTLQITTLDDVPISAVLKEVAPQVPEQDGSVVCVAQFVLL